MLFLVSILLVVGFSLFVSASLRLSSRSTYLSSIFLLSYGNNTFTGLIANSLLRLNQTWFWLLMQSLLLVGAFWIWRISNQPALFGPFTRREYLSRFLLVRWIKSVPDQALLVGITGAYFLFAILLNLVVPPNNNDSMGTHLSRVIYWLFNGSFFPWDTPRRMQLYYPVNAQLQLFWSILFWGSDRWAGFVQYVSGLACLVSVFGIARLLGARRDQALFACLVSSSYPVFLLQLSTPQNDLVAAGLFACLILLLISGIHHTKPQELALSGLAFGLMIGTKQTVLFLLPGLGALIVLIALFVRPRPWRSLTLWFGAVLVFTLLFGIYINISNWFHFGHPLGPPDEVRTSTGGLSPLDFLTNVSLNSIRFLYQMIDPSGIPDPIWGYSIKLKAMLFKPVFSFLSLPVEGTIATAPSHSFDLRYRPLMQEDSVWYGPLGFMFFIPVQVYQLIKGIKFRNPYRIGFPVIFFSFLLIDAAFRPGWDPFQSRYFLPAVVIGSSLLSFAYTPSLPSKVLRWIVTLLIGMVVLSVAFLNTAKPITGEKTIWNLDRTAKLTLQGHFMLDVTRMVDQEVPPNAILGMLNFGANWEYPLFGEHFTRRIVPIYPSQRLYDQQWIKNQRIQYILIQGESPEIPKIPGYLIPVRGFFEWVLYKVAP